MSGIDTFACFLDIRKAFPTVRGSSLTRALFDAGVTSKMWLAVASLYENTSSRVQAHEVKSDPYTANNGVREGAILSPLLYVIFINSLLVDLRNQDAGVTFPHPNKQETVRISALCYADDLVLLATSAKDMQKLLTACNKYAYEHQFKFGYDKTKYIIFNRRGANNRNVILTLDEMMGGEGKSDHPHRVESTDQYKYLGVRFHHSMKWTEHLKATVKHCKGKLASLRSALLNFNMLSPATAIDIMDSHVRSIIRYSCAVWAPPPISGISAHRGEVLLSGVLKPR